MARPRIKIDPKEVKALAQLGATVREIADFMHCSDATINNNFQAELYEGRASLKISIRRAQIRAALNGKSAVLLIWLGKQLLDQTDQPKNTDKETNEQLIKVLEDAKQSLISKLKNNQDKPDDPTK